MFSRSLFSRSNPSSPNIPSTPLPTSQYLPNMCYTTKIGNTLKIIESNYRIKNQNGDVIIKPVSPFLKDFLKKQGVNESNFNNPEFLSIWHTCQLVDPSNKIIPRGSPFYSEAFLNENISNTPNSVCPPFRGGKSRRKKPRTRRTRR